MTAESVFRSMREPMVIVTLAVVLYGWRQSMVTPQHSSGWLRRATLRASLASATVAVASHLGVIAYHAINPVLNSGSAVCSFGIGVVPILLGTVGAVCLAPFGSRAARIAAMAAGVVLVGLLWTL